MGVSQGGGAFFLPGNPSVARILERPIYCRHAAAAAIYTTNAGAAADIRADYPVMSLALPPSRLFRTIKLSLLYAGRAADPSYSTVFLTRALPYHGQIDTLELEPRHAAVASETFLDADLFPFPKIHIGPALDTLKTLSPPGSAEKSPEAGYDLVFIDADKQGVYEYFQESLRLTRKGGLIIVDNAVQRGRISREQEEGGRPVAGLRRLYDWVEADKGKSVLASGMQTVGSKYWE